MAITRWRPLRDLVSMQDEMNRLFDDFFGRPLVRTEWIEEVWSPSVDVSEDKDNVIVKAEMPGMKKKDANYHRIERNYGSFSRSFTLPTSVKADKVKASYKDGMLNITLPKTEEAKPKEIPVSIE
jgi:HSP20 family protein